MHTNNCIITKSIIPESEELSAVRKKNSRDQINLGHHQKPEGMMVQLKEDGIIQVREGRRIQAGALGGGGAWHISQTYRSSQSGWER